MYPRNSACIWSDGSFGTEVEKVVASTKEPQPKPSPHGGEVNLNGNNKGPD